MVGSIFAAGLAKLLFEKANKVVVTLAPFSLVELWRLYGLVCAAPAFLTTLAATRFVVNAHPGASSSSSMDDDEDSDDDDDEEAPAESEESRSLCPAGGGNVLTTDRRQRLWQPLINATNNKSVEFDDSRTLVHSGDDDDDERPNQRPNQQPHKTMLSFFTRRRGKLASFGVTYWGLNFGYYGLTTWITVVLAKVGVPDVYGVALLYAAANVPGNLAAFLAIDGLGRKPLLALSMGGATVAALALAAALEFFESPLAFTILAACLFNAFTTAGWAALDALTAESFPAADRATAVGVLTAVGRVASIAAQYVNGSLAAIPAVLLSVTAAFMFAGTLAVAGLRELKHRELDDD